MMAPPWLMLLIFATLVVIFLAVYRASGDKLLDSVSSAAGLSSILAIVVGALRYMQHGYTVLGASGAWAWTLAVIHMTLMLVIFFHGTYLGHKFIMTPLPPFLSERDRHYLYRRSQAWNRGRFLALLSAMVVVMIGLPDANAHTWRSVIADIAWIVPYAVIWLISVSVFARLLRRTGEEPKGVGENSVSCGSLLTLFVWALPLSRRGMEVLGISTVWTWILSVTLLLLLIAILVPSVFLVSAAMNGKGHSGGAFGAVGVGVLVAALFLAPVVWNDQPPYHNLIDITGIPFL